MSIDKLNNYDFGIVGLGVMGRNLLYKHNEIILAHIPMYVLIRKVSFTHFGIKGKSLNTRCNLCLKRKKAALYKKAAFYN